MSVVGAKVEGFERRGVWPGGSNVLVPFSSRVSFAVGFNTFPVCILTPVGATPRRVTVDVLATAIPAIITVPLITPDIPTIMEGAE